MVKKARKWDVYFNNKKKYPGLTIKDNGIIWKNMIITHNPERKRKHYKFINNPRKNDINDSYLILKVFEVDSKAKGKYLNEFKLKEKDRKNINKLLKNKKS